MLDHNGRTPLLFRNLAIDGPIRKVTRVPWVSEPQSLPGRETKPNAPSPFSSPGVKRMIGPPKNGAHKKLVEYDSGRPFFAARTGFIEFRRYPVTLQECAKRVVLMVDVLVEIVHGVQRWMFPTRMGDPKGGLLL